MKQWLQFLRATKRHRGGHGSPPPPPPPPPVANFTATPLSGTAPLFVTFTDTSTNTPNAWDWDFGDGGSSVSQNPTYTFTTPGDFDISLLASNTGGSDSEVKTGYVSVTGAVPRMTLSGQTIFDREGNAFIPRGTGIGHGELERTGDAAIMASIGANVRRIPLARWWTDDTTGFQTDAESDSDPGHMAPTYFDMVERQVNETHDAGLMVHGYFDSNCGQGIGTGGVCDLGAGVVDFASGTPESEAKKAKYIEMVVYVVTQLIDKIDSIEVLVEPSGNFTQTTYWDFCEELMDAVLAVDPDMLFVIGGHPNYQATDIDDSIRPGWTDIGSPYRNHVIATCNILTNLATNPSQRVDRINNYIVPARAALNVPVMIQQVGTRTDEDADDAHLDATLTLLDNASGGPIGYTVWEEFSVFSTSYGIYSLSDTGDPNSARVTKSNRLAIEQAHFTQSFGSSTYGELKLLAANMGPNYDYYTRVWVNLNNSGRAWCPSTNTAGYGYENVTLKSDGFPAAGTTSTRVFLADLQDEDADTYSFECSGNLATGAASISQAGGGTLSARSYNGGTNKTTCTITITGASDNIIALKFNNVPADFGAVKLHPSAYPLTSTVKFRSEALVHFANFDTLRFMDWLETNGSEGGWAEVGNQDTTWATSRAADYGSGWRHQHSLGACFDFFSEHGGQNIWTNIPAKAADSYFVSYVADGISRLVAGKKWLIEFGNELWNNALGESTAYQDIRTAAFTAANVRAGIDITSLSRSLGTTITAGVTAHGLITGATIYVRQKNNLFASGSKTITVVNANTISWLDSGTNGTISHADDDTFIFLNPTHTLCRPLVNYNQPENPTANYARIRYMLQRARALWTAVNNAGRTADVKVILGTWMASTFNYVPCLAWAVEEYGDLSWIYGVTPALYMEPANMNSGVGGINNVDDVFTGLDANAVITLGRAARWNNLMLTWGIRPMGYESGPHTHGGDGTSTPFIVAAHSDDRMRVRLKSWMQSWRNRGGQELCFFHAGITKQPTTGNATWPITYGSIADDATSVKFVAYDELYVEDAAATQENGVNFGTVRYIDVLPEDGAFLQQTSTWLLISPTKAVPDVSITLAFDAPGTYDIALDACTNGGATVAGTASLDGDLIWSGSLPSGSVFSVAPGEAFSTPVTVPAAGAYTFTFHVANASRGDWVGLYRCRVT